MRTKIVKCTGCRVHAYQDNKYGLFMRVANRAGTADNPRWRCTVCGSYVGESVTQKKK